MQDKIDREQFANLLYSIQYNNHIDPEDVKTLFSPMREWIKTNIPSKLYRFRQVNKYSINALVNDEIWGSAIRTFNDPYECLPCYDINKINELIDLEFSPEAFKDSLWKLSSGNIPEWMLATFAPEVIEALQKSSEQLLNIDLSEGMRLIRNNIVNSWNANMDQFQAQFVTDILLRENMYHVASFSESCRSTLMWAHYANSHTGFCLEYDFKSLIHDCSENCESILTCPGFMLNYSIAPVIYRENRYDASAGFMSMLSNWFIENHKIPMTNVYYDMFLPTKTMLTKSSAWEYEQEWRLFKPAPPSESTPHKLVSYMKPSAVYLGARIKEHNKQRLIKICKDKGIPCYQMLPQYFTATYESEPYQIL